jgi:hypothetical protein
VVTTWDGRVRIDHVAEAGTVAVTMLTQERTHEAVLRPGLVAAFVAADRSGPPSWIAVTLVDGHVPADVETLLGPRLTAAVDELLATGRTGGWAQLDLAEVDALASAWAPYRARVALSNAAGPDAPQVDEAAGVVGRGLWSWVGLPDLGTYAAPVLRGGEPDDALESRPDDDATGTAEARGAFRLPTDLARAAGVERTIAWTMTASGPRVQIELVARSRGPAAGELTVRVDDGSAAPVTFVEGPGGSWQATVDAPAGSVPLRFQVDA